MGKGHQSNLGILLLALLLLVGGLAAFSAYRADWFGVFQAKRPTYDKGLVDMVSVTGGFTVEDLNLSGPEIRKINFAAMSHRETFPHIHLTLDPVTKQKPKAVKRMTPMQYSPHLQDQGRDRSPLLEADGPAPRFRDQHGQFREAGGGRIPAHPRPAGPYAATRAPIHLIGFKGYSPNYPGFGTAPEAVRPGRPVPCPPGGCPGPGPRCESP